jgi:hypothetical protein
MQKTETFRVTPWVLTLSFVIAMIATVLLSFGRASAATLTQTMVRFDRMQVSTATTGTVCAKPATTGTATTVTVAFPTGYTVSGTTSNWTVSTTNLAWPTAGTAWLGIGTATNVTGQVVTFPSAALTVGTLYCFNWTNTAAVSVAATPASNLSGSVTTYNSTPAIIDTGLYSTAAVSSDQIAVSATVPQTFSFALSATTDPLGQLSSATVTPSPTPRTATISTNAKNGWYVWAKDANTGLTSASAGYTIASTTPGTASTLSAGTEGYNTGIATPTQAGGSGTITVAAPFTNPTSILGKGGGLNTTFAPLATSNGTANTAVLTLTNNAAISATTAAATDYADTITVVGAGLF